MGPVMPSFSQTAGKPEGFGFKVQWFAVKLVASGLSRREAIRLVRKKLGGGFPKETDVVELAALWSIDPSRLEDQDHPLGLGLAVRLPENLKQ
jgi:hypothetical protein